MKKITVFLNKTLQLLAVAAMLSVTINANAQMRTIYYEFPGVSTPDHADAYSETVNVPNADFYFFLSPITGFGAGPLEKADHTFAGWQSTIPSLGVDGFIAWNAGEYDPVSVRGEWMGTEMFLTAIWTLNSTLCEPQTLTAICQEDGTYRIEGTSVNATHLTVTVISGEGTATGDVIDNGGTTADTFWVEYVINSSDAASFVQLKIEFFNGNPLCEYEKCVEFYVNPTPSINLADIEIECLGETGKITINYPTTTTHSFLVLPATETYDSSNPDHVFVDNTVFVKNIGNYIVYLKDKITGCIGSLNNDTPVVLEGCCIDEIDVNITSAGKK